MKTNLNHNTLFNEIISCTIKVLNLLIKLYSSGKISHKEFEQNVTVKISFLQENIDLIEDKEMKTSIQSIIKQCNIILTSK